MIEYQGPQEGVEETFDEFEERIESNIYEARKALREGQKEMQLMDSEMRSLQFRVFNENQTTINQVQSEIYSLLQNLQKSIQ